MPIRDVAHDSIDELAATPPPVAPPIPPELWGLWEPDPSEREGGHWVPSIDDAPSGNTILVTFTKAEAVFASAHQNKSHGQNCRPVRIK